MDKFEMLLNELTSEYKEHKKAQIAKEAQSAEKAEETMTNPGNVREIVIRYLPENVESAKVVYARSESEAKDDSVALCYALGDLVGNFTHTNGKKLAEDLMKAQVHSLIGSAVDVLFEGVGDLLK